MNDLAALSTERDDVFRAVHRTWLGWVAAGQADGLRIDHPDGLFDPREYLAKLQQHARLAVARAAFAADPAKFPGVEFPRDEPALLEMLAGDGGEPLYVAVEKILADGEPLPADWQCAGTTGYEVANVVNGLFIDPAGEATLSATYAEFTGDSTPWPELVYLKKRQVMQSSLAGEVNALAHQLDRLARLDRRTRDFTLNGIRKAVREVIACFGAYRSYVTAEGAHDADKALVGKACGAAYRRNPQAGRAIFDFVRDTVFLKPPHAGDLAPGYRDAQARFAGKFQQVTAPVTAKGVEDTAFYVYHRLTSLNEVGGDPGRFGYSPDEVHEFFRRRAEKPGGLSPLTTHDTKRSEDVRARLNVLSEVPGEWAACVARWSEWARPQKVEAEPGVMAPDANEEYLLYQTVVGAWPFTGGGPIPPGDLAVFRGRVQAYLRKAVCEAKVHSSWINPDADYEAALEAFLGRLLDPDQSPEFLADVQAFATRIAAAGHLNGLAQTVVRCTAPGVPDTYQGTEFWDLSLVDPDNRRPVDYVARATTLAALDADPDAAARLAGELSDPAGKLFVTSRLLRLRREFPELFAAGGYEPLTVRGDDSARVFAFRRTHGEQSAIVVVPRLAYQSIGEDRWVEVEIPGPAGGQYRDVLTGRTVRLAAGLLPLEELMRDYHCAVLVRVGR